MGAGMTYDPNSRYVLLNGGAAASAIMNDTWAFSLSSYGGWRQLNAGWGGHFQSAFCRSQQAMAYDAADHYVVMFGGWGGAWPGSDCSISGSTAQNREQTAIWVEANQTWVDLCDPCTPSPSARTQSAFAFDTSINALLLYGGAYSGGVDGDTWEWTSGTWSQYSFGGTKCGDFGAGQGVCPTGLTPSPRDGAEMAYDPNDGYVALFGGCSGPSSNCGGSPTWYGDTWSFSAGTWTQVSTAGPSGRAWAGLELIDAGQSDSGNYNYDLLFGGESSSGADGDTWIYVPGPSVTGLTCSPNPVYMGQVLSCSTTTVGGIGKYSFAYNGFGPGCSPPMASSFSCNPSSVGTFTVTVTVTDTLGHSTQGSTSYTVYSIPSVTASAQTNPSDVNVAIQFASNPTGGDPPYSCSWEFGDGQGSTACSPTHAYAIAGTFSACVNVTDTNGVASVSPGCVSIVVNARPIITSFSASPSTIVLGKSTNLTVVSTGGTGSLSYSYAGLPPGCSSSNTPSLNCTPTSATGSPFTVSVTVTDALGVKSNKTTSLSVTVSPLVANVVLSTNGTHPGNLVWVNASASGGNIPYSYAWWLNGSVESWTGADVSYVPHGSGNYTFTVNVSDSSGQWINRQAVLEILPNGTYLPLTVALVLSANDTHPGIQVWFNATAAGGQGTYLFSWTENGLVYPGATSSVAFDPTGAGNYSFAVTVSDQVGQKTTRSMVLTVLPNSTKPGPLAVSLAANTTQVHTGGSVSLTGAASGGVAPYTYVWSLNGTNQSSLGSSPYLNLQFLHAGGYTYQLWVTDQSGHVVSSSKVVVEVVNPITGGPISANGIPIGIIAALVVLIAVILLLLFFVIWRRARGEPRNETPPAATGWVVQPIPPNPSADYLEGISIPPSEWDESAEPASAYGSYTLESREHAEFAETATGAVAKHSPDLDPYRPFSMIVTPEGIQVTEAPNANPKMADDAPGVAPTEVPSGPSSQNVYAVMQSLAGKPRSLDGIKQEVHIEDDELFSILGALTKAKLVGGGTKGETGIPVFVLTPLGRKVALRFIEAGKEEVRQVELKGSKPTTLPSGKWKPRKQERTVPRTKSIKVGKDTTLQDVHQIGTERESLEEASPFKTLRPEDVNPQLKGKQTLPKEILQPMEMRVQSDRGEDTRDTTETADADKRAQMLLERAKRDRKGKDKFGVQQAARPEEKRKSG